MKRVIYFLVFALLFLTGCNKSNLEPVDPINEKYSFPIVPGTPQWNAFTTGQQMVDACQIPENILKAITTRALVETCLSYPLYLNYMAYNDLDQGILSVISRFNGLSELYSRSNAITSILDVYEKMKVQVTATWTDGSMDFAFHIAYFEMVMSADCFFNKFTTSERTRLKTALWQKLYDRVQDPEHYSIFSIIEGLHLYAKVLKAQNDPVYVSNKVLIDYVSSVCRVEDQQYIDFANLIFF